MLLLLGCSSRPAPLLQEPDITGVITTLEASGGAGHLGVVRVETVPDDEAGTPKALVTITAGTGFEGFPVDGDPGFTLLQVGQRVHVWFAGPVRESYPVQGTAARIELASQAPREQ